MYKDKSIKISGKVFAELMHKGIEYSNKRGDLEPIISLLGMNEEGLIAKSEGLFSRECCTEMPTIPINMFTRGMIELANCKMQTVGICRLGKFKGRKKSYTWLVGESLHDTISQNNMFLLSIGKYGVRAETWGRGEHSRLEIEVV